MIDRKHSLSVCPVPGTRVAVGDCVRNWLTPCVSSASAASSLKASSGSAQKMSVVCAARMVSRSLSTVAAEDEPQTWRPRTARRRAGGMTVVSAGLQRPQNQQGLCSDRQPALHAAVGIFGSIFRSIPSDCKTSFCHRALRVTR